jgi:hypothetical protein
MRWPISVGGWRPRYSERKPSEIDARLFTRQDPLTRKDEWYFPIRGAVAGPYESRKIAKRILTAFVAAQKASGISNRYSS